MLVINGVELDFNYNDMDVAERFDNANQEMVAFCDGGYQSAGNMHQQGRAICDHARAAFDKIFGEGTGVKVCGEAYDLLKHSEAYAALTESVSEQVKEFDEHMKKIAKKPVNRATRRAAAKK